MTKVDRSVSAQFVDAARNHFLRFGFSRVSTEEIARSVGRSKKTLYKHFPTKERLLRAVLAQVDAETRGEVDALMAEGGDAVANLRRILTVVAMRVAATHQVLFSDLRASVPELGDQAWRERRQALTQDLRPAFMAAASAIRQDLPYEQVLDILFRCIEGVAGANEPEQQVQARISALVGLLVDGLRRMQRPAEGT